MDELIQKSTLVLRAENLLREVMDPEIPVLSVWDLGMITDVLENFDGSVTVKMIPTFTACPAIAVIKKEIKAKLESGLATDVVVEVDPYVAWNSDRISEKGKTALKNFAITPPAPLKEADENLALAGCPHCGSRNTTMSNLFGSTLCRSQHYCYDCRQAFERFKPVS